jgi:hypothetical protein
MHRAQALAQHRPFLTCLKQLSKEPILGEAKQSLTSNSAAIMQEAAWGNVAACRGGGAG